MQSFLVPYIFHSFRNHCFSVVLVPLLAIGCVYVSIICFNFFFDSDRFFLDAIFIFLVEINYYFIFITAIFFLYIFLHIDGEYQLHVELVFFGFSCPLCFPSSLRLYSINGIANKFIAFILFLQLNSFLMTLLIILHYFFFTLAFMYWFSIPLRSSTS